MPVDRGAVRRWPFGNALAWIGVGYAGCFGVMMLLCISLVQPLGALVIGGACLGLAWFIGQDIRMNRRAHAVWQAGRCVERTMTLRRLPDGTTRQGVSRWRWYAELARRDGAGPVDRVPIGLHEPVVQGLLDQPVPVEVYLDPADATKPIVIVHDDGMLISGPGELPPESADGGAVGRR